MPLSGRLRQVQDGIAAVVTRLAWRALPRAARRKVARRILVRAQARRVKRFLTAVTRPERLASVAPRDPVMPYLLRSGRSLIRFGDGEAAVLCGRNVWQVSDPSPEMREALFDLLFAYRSASPYVLAVASPAFEYPPRRVGDSAASDAWSRLRGLLSLALDLGGGRAPYFDALAFRHHDAGVIKEDPRPLWENAPAVVLVTNARVADRVRESGMFGVRPVHLVEVPEREAIASVGATVDGVRAMFREHGLVPREVPIVVGAGVAGKLIVQALMHDHTAYDIGAYLGPKHPEGRRGGAWRPERERRSESDG